MTEHTDIVRRVDDLGKVAIPKEVCERLHISSGDLVGILILGGNKICISKYIPKRDVLDYIDTRILKNIIVVQRKIKRFKQTIWR